MDKKWNLKEKKYKDFKVADGAITTASLYGRCAYCGRLINIKEIYISDLVCNDRGFSYAICKDCHNKEVEDISKCLGERDGSKME